VSNKVARTALDGIVWHERKVVGVYVAPGDDRFDLFTHADLHPFFLMAGRVCSVKTPEFSTPVMGAMYGTFDREPTMAEEFWTAVSKQGDGVQGDPATTLDTWLVDAKTADARPAMETYRACILAWNAFRHRKSFDKVPKYDARKGIPDIE
jgi:hypothetical protein